MAKGAIQSKKYKKSMEISAPTVDVKWGGGSTLGKFPHGPILTEMK